MRIPKNGRKEYVKQVIYQLLSLSETCGKEEEEEVFRQNWKSYLFGKAAEEEEEWIIGQFSAFLWGKK